MQALALSKKSEDCEVVLQSPWKASSLEHSIQSYAKEKEGCRNLSFNVPSFQTSMINGKDRISHHESLALNLISGLACTLL